MATVDELYLEYRLLAIEQPFMQLCNMREQLCLGGAAWQHFVLNVIRHIELVHTDPNARCVARHATRLPGVSIACRVTTGDRSRLRSHGKPISREASELN
jgi:hypothetical protein